MPSDNKPLLTIAIPTYNRFEQLKANLETIFERCDGEIQIFVCDNCSPDERVAPFLKQCKEEHANFDFVINEKNIGPDLNFLRALTTPSSTYVHLLGDDDIVSAGSENLLLDFLKKEHPLSAVLLSQDDMQSEVFAKEGLSNLLSSAGVWITFMSVLVFNQECLKKIENPSQFAGTNLIQAHLFLQTIRYSDLPFGFLPRYEFDEGGTNTDLSYDFCKVFIKNLYDTYSTSGVEAGLKKKEVNKVYKHIVPFVSRWIYLLRKNKNPHVIKPLSYFWKYMARYRKGWTMYLPSCLCPLWLLSFASHLKKKVKK